MHMAIVETPPAILRRVRTPAAHPLLAFESVGVVRDGRTVLDAVDLSVEAGGVTVVLGPSGSGKSTLLRLGNRLEVPSSGRVLFRGRDLRELDPLAHRRRVGMVFQRPTPFAGTVRDNLRIADPHADEPALVEALGRARLDAGFLDRPADELSGGESQRACLARTLIVAPEVLLMDEPTSALDEDSRRALERLAVGLTRDGVTIVWVTHDLAQARRIATRVVVLARGRVVAAGSTADAAVAAHLDAGGADGA